MVNFTKPPNSWWKTRFEFLLNITGLIYVADDLEGDEDYSEDSRRRKRRKRSTISPHQEYNIEIMVVADRKMAEYHGAEFKSYVLTLMSIVSSWINLMVILNLYVLTIKWWIPRPLDKSKAKWIRCTFKQYDFFKCQSRLKAKIVLKCS